MEHQFLLLGVALLQRFELVSINPQHFMKQFKKMPTHVTCGERRVVPRVHSNSERVVEQNTPLNLLYWSSITWPAWLSG